MALKALDYATDSTADSEANWSTTSSLLPLKPPSSRTQDTTTPSDNTTPPSPTSSEGDAGRLLGDGDSLTTVAPKNGKYKVTEQNPYFQSAALLTTSEEIVLGKQIQTFIQYQKRYLKLENKGFIDRSSASESVFRTWGKACGYWDASAEDGWREGLEEFVPSVFNKNSGPGGQRDGRRRSASLSIGKPGDNDEEEIEEWGKVRKGGRKEFIEVMRAGRDARQRMIESNMRLVISISRKYTIYGVSQSDLIQEGSLGLVRAAEKYDPGLGFKFSTYASWWIQQAVFLCIAYQSRTIRLPVHIHNLLSRIKKVRTEILSEGLTVTDELVASRIGMDVAKLGDVMKLTRKSISLDIMKFQNNNKRDDNNNLSILDTIPEKGPQGLVGEDGIDRSFLKKDLQNMMKNLSDDERNVINLRYGIDDGRFRPVSQVADLCKRDKSWVRGMECRALRKLRRPWYEEKLKDHQDAVEGIEAAGGGEWGADII
ncbi:hypothetical protein TrCOL_g2633 [Triparma columacea]|uniref:RNA polymerase sigma-70 domain-containing protein n=1 Tax=Triparma columacea TaxID=722753 RepID=A0A9W7LB84_9STRA|nr:hypothetical protein TrCOL_g2633 [Triparma columacea]